MALPMAFTSILAIYALLWVACAFVMLPFGIRTHDEVGEAKIPGQADSAPANFRPGRIALRASILAALLCALYVANYSYGWVDIGMVDFAPELPDEPAYDQLDKANNA
jgi:predicted secreted protein